MNARQLWKWGSTLLLMVALLALVAPAPVAARHALPVPPARHALPAPSTATDLALCQVPSPNPDYVNVLNAVATIPHSLPSLTPMQMWAVGYTAAQLPVNTARATLTMYYDGRSWNIVPSPNPGTINVLTAVAASGPNDVWAVGYTSDGSRTQPLMMHFNGRSWELVPAVPNTDAPQPWNTTLTDVQIVAGWTEHDVVVVGYSTNWRGPLPYARYYNGKTWAPMNLPPSMVFGRFTALAGDSLYNLWAVGTIEDQEISTGYLFRYVDNWKYKGWTAVTSAPGILTDVAVVEGQVYMVGFDTVAQNTETLAMAYTPAGGVTTRVKTMNKDFDHNYLTALAVSGGKVYAVGAAGNPKVEGALETLVLAYDGGSFTLVASPSPGLVNELRGATISEGKLWTVGTIQQGLSYTTLVLAQLGNCDMTQ